MSKYGWTKGSGLGASGSGIVNPLRAQVMKQKKKPDAEGGGFVGPGGMGKIVGGKKKGGNRDGTEEGKFGVMSEVIVLKGMIDGMDLDAELEGSGDGGLMQEIGEECAEKVRRLAPFAVSPPSNAYTNNFSRSMAGLRESSSIVPHPSQRPSLSNSPVSCRPCG